MDTEEYQVVRNGKHRDSTVVSCDVQRSLWSFTEGAARRLTSRLVAQRRKLSLRWTESPPLGCRVER